MRGLGGGRRGLIYTVYTHTAQKSWSSFHSEAFLYLLWILRKRSNMTHLTGVLTIGHIPNFLKLKYTHNFKSITFGIHFLTNVI